MKKIILITLAILLFWLGTQFDKIKEMEFTQKAFAQTEYSYKFVKKKLLDAKDIKSKLETAFGISPIGVEVDDDAIIITAQQELNSTQLDVLKAKAEKFNFFIETEEF